MSGSKLPVWLIATMMLLSMGFVLYPQGSANAAKYCAQLTEFAIAHRMGGHATATYPSAICSSARRPCALRARDTYQVSKMSSQGRGATAEGTAASPSRPPRTSLGTLRLERSEPSS